MKQPKLEDMGNWNAILSWFHDVWTTTFTLPNLDLSLPDYETCKKEWFTLISSDNQNQLKKIPYTKFQQGATFNVSGTYQWAGLGLTFSSSQKDFLSNHGRLAFQADSGFAQAMIQQISYEGPGDIPINGGGDERVNNYQKIGGSQESYQRYSYNTLFVTSDLLLHVYHRLFDNGLKYYEEATARPMITDLAQTLFTKFTKLADTTTDQNLKKNYEFLAAYRSIPYAILIPNSDLIKHITTNTNTEADPAWSADLTDAQIQSTIQQRMKTALTKLDPVYQQAVQDTLQEIFKADNTDGKNTLLSAFSADMMNNLTGVSVLKFDYTQFKPRAHYTTDSFLKTYFMAMKWMMREKLYFADKNIAAASLIMVNDLKGTDLTSFTTYYNFIEKLIGEDDDTNISDIQLFISKQQRSSDTDILNGITDTIQKQLLALRPQKIISVSYTTPTVEQLSEQEAKNMTNGFVFFGEKFTIDSRLFDQFTAWSAEKESTYKPPVQSALMVIDNLINTPLTTKYAKLRLEQNKWAFDIKDGQIQGYDQAKSETMNNPELTGFDFTRSIYHEWLNTLSRLFVPGGINAPYFMQDSGYQNKLLTTYLGSYTELKHDTLLYVKQAYAEMWGWGEWPCAISVNPPALPVPKWYVEPNIDLIDQLINLTQQTNTFFSGQSNLDFITFLNLAKKIGIAQTQNAKISDADFDTLRLYANKLTNITTPEKLIGLPLQKEKRSSIIADIFTSGEYGPLYEAVGRPYLLAVMINDVNGARIVIGPMFSHYEFYGTPIPSKTAGRYTDEDRQNSYDTLWSAKETTLMSLPFQTLIWDTLQK